MKTDGSNAVPKQAQPEQPKQGGAQAPVVQQKKQTTAQPTTFKGGLKDWFAKNRQSVESLLPNTLDFRRFARLTVEVLAQNPKLSAAQPLSLMLSIMKAAADGLEPDGRKACIVPYGDHGVTKAQYQRMYGGVIEHCYRTGQYKVITGGVVHANDEFEYARGFPENRLNHKPATGERGDVIGYWAGYQLVNGGYDFVYLPKEACLAHGRRYSKTFNNPDGPWQKNQDAMCLKTVLLQAVKYAPQSIEDIRVVNPIAASPKIEDAKPMIRTDDLVPLAVPEGGATEITAEVVPEGDEEDQEA
jgi:recombination protein RecT